MDKHDKKVLEKILQHIASTMKYCEKCSSLADFEGDSMRVEACVLLGKFYLHKRKGIYII